MESHSLYEIYGMDSGTSYHAVQKSDHNIWLLRLITLAPLPKKIALNTTTDNSIIQK